jgi:hypothetical protein
MEKEKYMIEFTWGDNNPIHEEMEIETDNINWSLDQIGIHRNCIKFTKVEKI